MFAELLPILRNRALMITIGLVNEQAIRVHVIPKAGEERRFGGQRFDEPLDGYGNSGGVGSGFCRPTGGIHEFVCEAGVEPLRN